MIRTESPPVMFYAKICLVQDLLGRSFRVSVAEARLPRHQFQAVIKLILSCFDSTMSVRVLEVWLSIISNHCLHRQVNDIISADVATLILVSLLQFLTNFTGPWNLELHWLDFHPKAFRTGSLHRWHLPFWQSNLCDAC